MPEDLQAGLKTPDAYRAQLKPAADGFATGFTSIFRGIGFLSRSARAWPYAAVPLGVVLAVSAGLTALILHYLRPWLGSLVEPEEGAVWWSETLAWTGGALAIVGGLFIAYSLASPLSAPALEKLVEYREAALGAPRRKPRGFFWELKAGFRAALGAWLFTTPLWLLVWAVEFWVPALAPFTLSAKLLLTSVSVSWMLLDYPLTLRGVLLRDRLKLWKSDPGLVLGFGTAFAALFWVPCFGLLMLPVGVLAAAEVSWRLVLGHWAADGWHPEFEPAAGAYH